MKQIILIRHGEKNEAVDPVHLSERGICRAHYLIDYFLHPINEFRIPESIYAMRQISPDSSNRCVETVEGLAHATGVSLNNEFSFYQVDQLVHTVLQDRANVVLICWEHKAIPMIARLLGFRTVSSWGFYPLNQENDHECFSSTWVVSENRLNVYHQFEIDDNLHKYYPFPRNEIVCSVEKENKKEKEKEKEKDNDSRKSHHRVCRLFNVRFLGNYF